MQKKIKIQTGQEFASYSCVYLLIAGICELNRHVLNESCDFGVKHTT